MEEKSGVAKTGDAIAPSAIDAAVLSQIALAGLRVSPDAVIVADMRERDTPLIWISDQFTAVTGYSQADALGKNCRYLQGNDRLQPELDDLRTALWNGTRTTVTLRNYRKNGTLFWNELTVTPYANDDENVQYCIGIIRDVTGAKESSEQVVRQARSDHLTGLPNRDRFLEEIETIALSDEDRLLVVKLDIAGLHNINSTYGYEAGDEVIRKTAQRLQSLKVAALSRIGNNEFALVAVLPPNENETELLANISTTLRPPFAISDAIVMSRYALGYVLGSPGQSGAVLTQQAGYALHESKSDPTRAPRRFDFHAERKSQLRGRITTELQQAIRDGDFTYHYQPQYELATNGIVGVEALIRWSHPVFGLQPPDFFIGIAEETGLIIDIERAGIHEVAKMASQINADRAVPLTFSFNISPLEVTRANLAGLVGEVIASTGIDPNWLTMELTESLLTESSGEVIELFTHLRAIGVGLSIDDFGTGYSSLRSIERFPISEIKIDRTFIQDMLANGTKRIVIDTILALGRELNVKVVAEGIDAEEQLSELKRIDGLIGQGYLLGRPLPAAALRSLLAQ